MRDLEPMLAALVDEWLELAWKTDEGGREELGAGQRGDEHPEHAKE